MADLDEIQKAILSALATVDDPAECGEITGKTGLPTPGTVPNMRGLLKSELVERLLEGKYVISALGRSV